MKRAFFFCMLQLALASFLVLTPALQAQSVDQDLPNEPIELALWKADVEIVLEEGATPHLSARAVRAGAPDEEVEGPTVRVGKKGATWRILRAAEAQDVRLRIVLTLDQTQQVKLTGSDVSASIEGPPIDFRAMAALRESATDGGGEVPAPMWSDVTVALAGSQVDVTGISGGNLQGRDTYFVVRQSSNFLRVELDGGGAEITEHRGELELFGAGEYVLNDVNGKNTLGLTGGSLEVTIGEGVLQGKITQTSTRVFEWMGLLNLESRGGDLSLQNFRDGRQEITVIANGTEVDIQGIPSSILDVQQKGGSLHVREVDGKNKLEMSEGGEVEISQLTGPWVLLLQDSSGRGEELERLTLQSYSSEFEVSEIKDLELTAHGSTITATKLRRLGKGSLTNSEGSFELLEGGRGEIDAQEESRATVGMSRPCFVLTGREGMPEGDSEGLEVFGCTEGPNVNPSNGEEESPSYFTVTLGGESTVDVRGF